MPIAMAFEQYGPPEVLRPLELTDLQPGPGQVRVQVRAAGVQPFDCSLRAGTFSKWMQISFPRRLGNEFAGVVEEAGEGVTRFAPGDEVIGWDPMQSYAQALVVDSRQIVGKPAGMPWEEAGVLSASGQTAHTAIQELRVGPGATVLIHAAAGGVGTFAVQLARELGATVIGTASEHNHEYLRSLGAIPVTYGQGLEQRVRRVAPRDIDAALDCIGGEALDVSVRLIADRTRIGTVADHVGADRLGVLNIGTRRSRARLSELIDLYEKDRLKVSIWKSFPLPEAAKAHHEVETGHVRGKVVLTAIGS